MDALEKLEALRKDKKLLERIDLLIAEWERTFLTVNIKKELQLANAWLVSHPERPKKNLTRFLYNWMDSNERRNQERRQNNRRAPSLPPPPRHEVPDDEIVTGDMFGSLKEQLLAIKLRGKGA